MTILRGGGREAVRASAMRIHPVSPGMTRKALAMEGPEDGKKKCRSFDYVRREVRDGLRSG
jgi:hypothetical protein